MFDNNQTFNYTVYKLKDKTSKGRGDMLKFENSKIIGSAKNVIRDGEQVGVLEKFKGGWAFTPQSEDFDDFWDRDFETLKDARIVLGSV